MTFVMQRAEPEPIYIYGIGAVKHIARPDHPYGRDHTEIAFCGAYETELEPPDDRRVCRRCALSWIAYLDRIARERARDEDDQRT